MKKILIVFILVGGLSFSCDDYLDVNTDPNNPTQVTPDLILPTAQNYTARWMQIDRSVNHLGNMIMYNFSESAGFSWYDNEFLYLVNSTFYGGIFNNAYTQGLKQYHILENLDENQYEGYIGIAKIMKAYTYQILVDFYGDIPYEEALGRSLNATPSYNTGAEVYAMMIQDLTAAIEMLDAAEANDLSVLPENDDVIFGGDLEDWRAFANTIKLRILNRGESVLGSTVVTDELAVIAAQGSGYITSDVEINPGYVNEQNKQNPLWEDFGASVDGTVTLSGDATCASDFIITYLQNTGDPRINFIFEQPAAGHQGVPQGIEASTDTQGPDDVSNMGPGLLAGVDQGAKILTLAESLFIRAELALNGYGGDPATLYDAGVTASFATLGAGSSAAYLGQAIDNVSYASSTDKLEAIITQKWLATMGITAEQSWFDHSRTGYPSGIPVSNAAAGLARPVRLAYPASEVSGNSLNVPTQPDVFTSKVFWAQ